MASTPFMPPAMWESGTNQNSIPANDNALRLWILNSNVNNATTAQPVSPTEGATYIIQSTHTGTQWATFTPNDVAIYSGGNWYAYAPVNGMRLSVGGALYAYNGSVWSAVAGTAYDMFSTLQSAEISVTGATTATISRMHVCSGTSADYTVTLPAVSGNAGKFLGVRMAPGLTRWVTVKGNASENIDGQNTRLMWANEAAILFCDGATWTKVAGKSVPLSTSMQRTTAQALTAAAWTIIPTPTSISDNSSALAVPAADTTNGRIRCLRSGRYVMNGFVGAVSVTAGRLIAGGATVGNFTPGLQPSSPGAWSAGLASAAGATSGSTYAQGSTSTSATVGQFFYLVSYNDDTVNRNTSTIDPQSISVNELPTW